MPAPTGSSNHIDNLEHHSGLRAKKVLPYVSDGAGNAVLEVTGDLALKYVADGSVDTTYYLGTAAPGSDGADAVWQIKKIDESTGTVITWADGNSDFDNVWDDRESLTYA